MNLIALPAFTDNCIWMFHDGREAVVVDPGDAAPLLAALTADRLSLAAILVTRHHDDPVGAVDALRDQLRGPVCGPAHETIAAPSVALSGGHTRGHVACFHNGADQAPLLFCGDTFPTLPATIARERLIHPFLRCAEPAVAQAAQQHGATSRDPVDVFAALRQWTNDFR